MNRFLQPLFTILCMSMLILSTCSTSSAYDINGDLKLFHMMNGAPRGLESIGGTSSGALTSRLIFKDSWGNIKLETHGLLNVLQQKNGSSLFSLSPNLQQVGEFLPLSYLAIDDGDAIAILRADRFLLTYEWSQFRLTMGRQAISFGQGRVFTPLDRVSPFSPASVDREYKPGVDAIRFDGYWGIAGEWTFIAAQRGDFELEQSVLGAKVRDTFGNWDLAFFALWVGGDQVLGLSVTGALSELSLYSDFSYTWRPPSGMLAKADELRGETAPFIRAVVGGDWSWSAGDGGRLNLELAFLGDGVSSSQNYLSATLDPRLKRGERWLLGQQYLALSAIQSLSPLISSSLSIISNLQDPSALIGPAISWSVSDEVNANIGGYLGVGEGVKDLVPQSELGALTWLTFVMMSAHY